ncbi:MAG: hypothetical protein C5B49_03350 [Bdellovibrio sp.]|nr:MAG: hypothetical protein C5B49_03350 [Bdellovibrio sp.]
MIHMIHLIFGALLAPAQEPHFHELARGSAEVPTAPTMSSAAHAPETVDASVPPERALQELIAQGQKIAIEPVRRTAVSQNGRIKPVDTLARESVLLLTGSYERFGLKPVQLYFALASTPSAPWAPVVEVRDAKLRQRLGYLKEKRFFSAAELEASPLIELVQPLMKNQEESGRLSEEEKKVMETFSQLNLIRQIILGENFIHAVDFSFLKPHTSGSAEGHGAATEVASQASDYLQQLRGDARQANLLAPALVETSRRQEAPQIFQHYLGTLDSEIFYNDARPFLWASLIALLAGLLLSLDITRQKLTAKAVPWLYLVTLLPLVLGISLRVYITQFAPVTNMFTTMLWVSLGVLIFSAILYYLYRNSLVSGVMLIGTGLILMLTEQIPLILSPDLDPLVAVLRSNFWLSTHVTTITISYAAFTIAMLLGNVALVRSLMPGDHTQFFHQYAHYAYRMIQLGCFLLSVGIILGGVWADYSWGRFWGWDPKETWALIADMGFLTLLHARITGWVKSFMLLALSPVAYLLVIMAWYGVNFILATGLHSYGFSSGGALMVGIFVGLQLLIFALALTKFFMSPRPAI